MNSAPSSVTAWRNAVFVVFTVNGLGMAAWISRIPALRDQLDIPVSQVGILLFAISTGAILGLLISGHLVHAIGGAQTIRVTLLAFGLGLILTGVATTVLSNFLLALLGMAITGFAGAVCDVAMNVEGADAERALGRNIMPWYHASWSLGTVAGAGIGSAAAFAGVPVLVHLGLMGVVLAVAAVVVPRWLPAHITEEEGQEPRPGFRERMAIWRDPRTLLIGLIVLGMAFTEGSANDWLALALIDAHDLENGTGALLFGVFAAAMTIGRIVGVPILDRFGRVPVLRASALTAAVGLAIVILVPIPALYVVGIVLWGLGASLGFPVGMSAAADDARTAAARVSAVATVGYFAFLVGPPLIGFAGELIGLLNALFIVLALIVLSAVMSPAAREPAPAPDDEPVDAS